MDIRNFIQQKKREFFTAKDTAGLREQHLILAAQRKELEEREALRQQVIAEQQAVRGLNSAPARQRLQSLQGGFQAFQNAGSRANQFFHGDTPPGLQHAQKRLEGMPEPSNGALNAPKPHILGGRKQ